MSGLSSIAQELKPKQFSGVQAAPDFNMVCESPRVAAAKNSQKMDFHETNKSGKGEKCHTVSEVASDSQSEEGDKFAILD